MCNLIDLSWVSGSGKQKNFKEVVQILKNSIATGSKIFIGTDSFKTKNNGEAISITDDNIDLGFGSSWQLELRKDEGVVLYDLAHVSPLLSKDFRIEGSGDTHLFFVSGNDARIGIGSSTPSHKLTVSGSISASGDLIANRFLFEPSLIGLHITDSNTTGNVFGNSTTTKIQIGKAGTTTSTIIQSSITASGDISSSGTINSNIVALNGSKFATRNYGGGHDGYA